MTNLTTQRVSALEGAAPKRSMSSSRTDDQSSISSSLPSQLPRPYIIGVCGSTCSGKTTLCNILRKELSSLNVAFLPSDSYYKELTDEDKAKAYVSEYDFDHPRALAFDELTADLEALKKVTRPIEMSPTKGHELSISSTGSTTEASPRMEEETEEAAAAASSSTAGASLSLESRISAAGSLDGNGASSPRGVRIPKYDFTTHSRVDNSGPECFIPCSDVIIVEGILIYAAGKELRDQMDLRVFIDCDSDIVVLRRLQRDIAERGRDFQGIKDQYMKYVKPSYEEFVEPSKKYADVIIPNTRDGELSTNPAIDMLIHHIKTKLREQRKVREQTLGSLEQNTYLEVEA